MKSFYDVTNAAWTKEAGDADREIVSALQPIFDKFVAMGYSAREIAHLVSNAGIFLETKTLVYAQIKARETLTTIKEVTAFATEQHKEGIK